MAELIWKWLICVTIAALCYMDVSYEIYMFVWRDKRQAIQLQGRDYQCIYYGKNCYMAHPTVRLWEDITKKIGR